MSTCGLIRRDPQIRKMKGDVEVLEWTDPDMSL